MLKDVSTQNTFDLVFVFCRFPYTAYKCVSCITFLTCIFFEAAVWMNTDIQKEEWEYLISQEFNIWMGTEICDNEPLKDFRAFFIIIILMAIRSAN